MRKFSSRLLSSSFLAIAISIFVVGLVWASSTALQISNGGSSQVVGTAPDEEEDGGDGDLPDIEPGDEIDELRQMVVDLTSQVETLTEVISTLQTDVSNVEVVARDAASEAGQVKSIADDAATDAGEARRIARDVSSRFRAIELRTSKLNELGVYSGVINPNQLSRKLTPADMSGDWPLNRVTGELESRHLIMPFSGNCSSRSGFYTVLVSDSSRRVTCERIAIR